MPPFFGKKTTLKIAYFKALCDYLKHYLFILASFLLLTYCSAKLSSKTGSDAFIIYNEEKYLKKTPILLPICFIDPL